MIILMSAIVPNPSTNHVMRVIVCIKISPVSELPNGKCRIINEQRNHPTRMELKYDLFDLTCKK